MTDALVWKETITKYMDEVFKDIKEAIDKGDVGAVMDVVSDMFVDGTANYLLHYAEEQAAGMKLEQILVTIRAEILKTYSDESAKMRRATFKPVGPDKGSGKEPATEG